MIQSFLSSDLAWRLGWTLLHSIWQVAALSVIIFTVLSLMTRATASARHVVACFGMAAMLVPLLATFAVVEPRPFQLATVEPVQALQVRHGETEQAAFPGPVQRVEVRPTA